MNDDYELYGEALWLVVAVCASHIWWQHGCIIWAVWGLGVISWLVIRAAIEGETERNGHNQSPRAKRHHGRTDGRGA